MTSCNPAGKITSLCYPTLLDAFTGAPRCQLRSQMYSRQLLCHGASSRLALQALMLTGSGLYPAGVIEDANGSLKLTYLFSWCLTGNIALA